MFTQILDNSFNNTIRKYVIIFGSLFNSVYTQTSRNGIIEKRRVPISYGPKEKFIQLIIGESGLTDQTHIQMDLPRMGFEMINLQYDPMRRLNKLQKKRKTVNGVELQAYSESPYQFTFGLYVFARSSEHNLQVIEQIVPFFTPEFTITANMNDLYQKVDIPIVLGDVNINEDYDGTFDQRRGIVSTLTFNMKGYIYTPIKENPTGIINKVDVNLYRNEILGSNFMLDVGYTGDYLIGPSSITWAPEGQV